MEPIVVPMHVRWVSGTTASPKTYGTGTLVMLDKRGEPPIVEATAVTAGIIGTKESSGVFLGRYVQPPNVIDARRGTKDVILFNPEPRASYVILADPLVLGCDQTKDPRSGQFFADVYISAAVGGVVEFDFGPHVHEGHKFSDEMKSTDGLAVASAPIFFDGMVIAEIGEGKADTLKRLIEKDAVTDSDDDLVSAAKLGS
jgi:hypothetical protein